MDRGRTKSWPGEHRASASARHPKVVSVEPLRQGQQANGSTATISVSGFWSYRRQAGRRARRSWNTADAAITHRGASTMAAAPAPLADDRLVKADVVETGRARSWCSRGLPHPRPPQYGDTEGSQRIREWAPVTGSYPTEAVFGAAGLHHALTVGFLLVGGPDHVIALHVKARCKRKR